MLRLPEHLPEPANKRRRLGYSADSMEVPYKCSVDTYTETAHTYTDIMDTFTNDEMMQTLYDWDAYAEEADDVFWTPDDTWFLYGSWWWSSKSGWWTDVNTDWEM